MTTWSREMSMKTHSATRLNLIFGLGEQLKFIITVSTTLYTRY
jgi:hypothetical protein